MPNDVLMFEKSGMSIAMGNASEFVKGKANFVTYSNEEDGFDYAIERFCIEPNQQFVRFVSCLTGRSKNRRSYF